MAIFEWNVEFNLQGLCGTPSLAISLLDKIGRISDSLNLLPIVEVNSLPDVSLEVPEVMKLLRCINCVGEMIERVKKNSNRDLLPRE